MYKSLTAFSALVLIALVLVPVPASAASRKTTCSLEVSTNEDSARITKEGDVLVHTGDSLTIAWDSENASKATDGSGKSIEESGTMTVSPTKQTTYTFRFSGDKKATCAVTAHVVDGKFDSSSLSSTSGKPTISGTISGVKKAQLTITKEGSTKVLWKKSVKPKGGKFSAKVSKALPTGTYTVTLVGDKDMELNTVATGTLTIGASSSSSAKSGGTFSVGTVPLLFGGSVTAGASTPVAYLQIKNVGTAPASFTGVRIKQTGSAPVRAITGLEVRDDKGMTRGLLSLGQGSTPFSSDGTATAPANVTLAAGEIRLFTVRVTLAQNAGLYLGQQLMIDVLSLEGATAKGGFPLKGTTWTIR